MGIFRKKEKTYNKTTVIIIEIAVALVILLVGIGIKWLINNHDKDNGKVRIEDQVVEGISFVDFLYNEDTSEYLVNAINYNVATINIKELKLYIYSDENAQVAAVTFEGFDLEYNESHELKGKLPEGTSISTVEYAVELAD